MPRGRPIAPLALDDDAEAQLLSIARSRALPHALVRRAQIVLACAASESNAAVAERMGLSRPTVGKWRSRYLEQGIEGLHDELRPGAPPQPRRQARGRGHQRCAQLAPAQRHPLDGPLDGRAQRRVQEHRGPLVRPVRVQPHRQRTFKLSTDPSFVEKVRDIVGLYLNPPDHAVVLCVDEKSRVQAPGRTQPMLPMGLGYVEGVTHDYARHGTRSSSPSCATSTAASPKASTCTWWWTTTPPTSTPR